MSRPSSRLGWAAAAMIALRRRHRPWPAELGPSRRGTRSRHATESDEPHAFGTRQDAPVLLGPDADHHPGPQLDTTIIRDQRRRPLERDVDLLLVGVLHARIMAMVRIA